MLNEKIRALRKEHGYSQEQMARKLHLTQGAISQWENGLTAPAAEQLVTLADAFDISVDELLDHKTQTAADKGGMREAVMRLHDEIDGLTDDESDLVLALLEKIKGARKPL